MSKWFQKKGTTQVVERNVKVYSCKKKLLEKENKRDLMNFKDSELQECCGKGFLFAVTIILSMFLHMK